MPSRKSAFKDNSQIVRGRGKGGLSLLWPASIDHLISRVPVPNNKRVQGIIMNIDKCKLLVINTYFPTDNLSKQIDETELQQTIAGIKWLFDNTESDQVLWMGDQNYDARRDSRHEEKRHDPGYRCVTRVMVGNLSLIHI